MVLVPAPSVGAWLDLGSWFGLKFLSEKWEYLSMVGGTMFAGSFLAMFCISMYQMWLAKPDPPAGRHVQRL